MTTPDPFPRLTRRAAARRGGNTVIAEQAQPHLDTIGRLLNATERGRTPASTTVRAARKAHTALVQLLTAPIDPTGAGD